MRNRAYRRAQQAKHYLRRAGNIYHTYGGYVIVGDKIVKKAESFNTYMEISNPYILKNQGNFENHANFWHKCDIKRSKKKLRTYGKRIISQELNRSN